jgi:hypothetical protein
MGKCGQTACQQQASCSYSAHNTKADETLLASGLMVPSTVPEVTLIAKILSLFEK